MRALRRSLNETTSFFTATDWEIEARVTEREQAGRAVFRVRVGPFDRKEEADKSKERLESNGMDTALVRVAR